MSGFKTGASPDPYDDEDGEGDSEDGEEDVGDPEDVHGVRESATTDDVGGTERTRDSHQSTESSATQTVPWRFRRSGITDGRPETRQLHMQEETFQQEDHARRDLREQLGEKPKKADLREAAYLVGMRHLDEVADVLQEWGYDVE